MPTSPGGAGTMGVVTQRPGQTDGVAPAGWPAEVRPPGTPGWERTAVAWLLDLAPADYRGYRVLTGHPVALARVVAHHVQAQQAGARAAVANARRDLSDALPQPARAELLDVLATEEARLGAAARSVGLVEEALRGRRFTPRL
jgi:hypothetical protein